MKIFNFLKSRLPTKDKVISQNFKYQYDLIAEQYTKYIDGQKLNALYERPYILSQLPALSGLTFLDAGCGSGFFSKRAHEQGAKVIAIDISKNLLEIVRKETNAEIETHVADLSSNLDFIKSGTIDVIVCSLVLHYIEDWSISLNEFQRVLKPGGLCLISVHHPLFDQRFNSENYFEKRAVEDSWVGFGSTPLKVRYFVRPLKEYINPILNSHWNTFSIDEPLPAVELEETHPDLFRKLSNTPVFLFFRLIK